MVHADVKVNPCFDAQVSILNSNLLEQGLG